MTKTAPSEIVATLKRRWNGTIQASADPQKEGSQLLLQAIAAGRQRAIDSLPLTHKDQGRELLDEAVQLLKTNGLEVQASAHAQTVKDYQVMQLEAELETLRAVHPAPLQRKMILIELAARASGRAW